MILAETRHIDQRDRIEDPDISLRNSGYLIFDKGAKNTYWVNGIIINKNSQKTWMSLNNKIMKPVSYSSHYT